MLSSNATELEQPYPLDAKLITRFRDDGFILLKNVFSAELISQYASEINQLVDEGNRLKDVPLEKRSLYDRAFIQVGNLWEQSDCIREFAFSRRLASIATRLMGTRGVRMWHDQALYKEASGGFTPWHVDQQYWPMSNSNSVTAWIPLQPVPFEMGPLCFGRGTHRRRIGRDLEISAESEKEIARNIKAEKIEEVQEPFDLGDVSFHLGWTLHRAGPNQTNVPRRVFTIIYMDSEMCLAPPKNKNQEADWRRWTPSTNIGEVMDDRLNPVLFYETGLDPRPVHGVADSDE